MVALDTTNLLLAELDRSVLDALAPHMERTSFKQGFYFYRHGELLRSAWFLESGLSSHITTLSDGFVVETSAIGRDSALGLSPDLNPRPAFGDCVAQVSGSGLRIDLPRLREVCEAHPSLRRRLDVAQELLSSDSRQSAACLARHEVEPRMCRWLLRCQDRVQSDELPLTQEFLSHMLGTQRSTVSVTAGVLEADGLIRYSRGRIAVLDRAGLEVRACECYATMRERARELGFRL